MCEWCIALCIRISMKCKTLKQNNRVLKKIFTQLHPSYLEQYCVRVASQVALALDLHQDLDIVVLGEGDGLLGGSGGHDGGQPGQQRGAGRQEPCDHLHVHEEQREHRHGRGVHHVHETLPATVGDMS